MNKFVLRAVSAAAGLAALSLPMSAIAASSIATGAATPLTTSANLDFSVTIPRVLSLRVGTGAVMTTNGTINLIDFTVPAANVGDGAPIAGSGTVTAHVRANATGVTLSATTGGALISGANTLSYTQITTAASVLTSATALPAPLLTDGPTAGPSVSVPAAGNITNADATWTYSYANAALVPAGVYGGAGVNNGRVIYTASMP